VKNKFIFVVLISVLVPLFLGRDSLSTSKPNLEQFDLKEGDIIRSEEGNDLDIYIVNEYGYKRLFLNPAIFDFYGHLGGFRNVKLVSNEARDHFETSALFRNCESGDGKVYALELTGEDEGTLHWINMDGMIAVKNNSEFFKKVFCINSHEFSWYNIGPSYTSLVQIPDYSFTIPVPPAKLSVDLKINNSKNPDPTNWNSALTATWTSQNAVRCSGMYYIALSDENVDRDNLPTQGTLSFYGRNTVPSDLEEVIAQVLCYDKDENYTDDYVVIPIKGGLPSIKNVNVSSSHVMLGNKYKVSWESEKLNFNVNIILGKGEPDKRGNFWYIAKNIPNTGNYDWDTSIPVTPDIGRSTLSDKIEPGEYFLLIFNNEETFFGSSLNSFEILN